ncbi:hypothetical protein D7I43_19400 [Micromonospora globbae]|uniref:Uncharacterized protein n=1 Tax=Micromonospora globbae TaxID=1894969 RepID=A0A420EY02_9ACTN|nr:hypothetical protein D7I43_19400 [Micromonospora globbae]
MEITEPRPRRATATPSVSVPAAPIAPPRSPAVHGEHHGHGPPTFLPAPAVYGGRSPAARPADIAPGFRPRRASPVRPGQRRRAPLPDGPGATPVVGVVEPSGQARSMLVAVSSV